MASTVILRGLREFEGSLDAHNERVLAASKRIVEQGALIIAGRARETFRGRPGGQVVSAKGKTYYSFKPPYQATPPTPTSRSGKLQRSVGTYYRVTMVEGGWMAETGTKVKYAPFVEYGTVHMAKEPYMSVGIDHSRSEIESLAELEWAKAVM